MSLFKAYPRNNRITVFSDGIYQYQSGFFGFVGVYLTRLMKCSFSPEMCPLVLSAIELANADANLSVLVNTNKVCKHGILSIFRGVFSNSCIYKFLFLKTMSDSWIYF